MRVMLEIDRGLSVQRDAVQGVRSLDDGKFCKVLVGCHEFIVKRSYEETMNALHAPEVDVMEAAQTLVDLLDQAAPHLHRLSEIGLAADMPYQGPQFKNELEDLRIALAQAR
jgi:hypothetical protein